MMTDWIATGQTLEISIACWASSALAGEPVTLEQQDQPRREQRENQELRPGEQGLSTQILPQPADV